MTPVAPHGAAVDSVARAWGGLRPMGRPWIPWSVPVYTMPGPWGHGRGPRGCFRNGEGRGAVYMRKAPDRSRGGSGSGRGEFK